MLFWTRHANFRRVQNDIYDPSTRIIKNPLNSMIFWTGHVNSATCQSRDASTQLGDASNFTLKYNSIFRRSVISSWLRVHSTRRSVKNAIMTPMAYHSIGCAMKYCMSILL